MITKKGENRILAVWLCACLCILWAMGCSSPPGSVHHLTAKEARSLIDRHAGDKDFVILDVRTPREYRAGHISQAVLLDFHNPAFSASLKKLERSKTYLIYCQTGYRSSRTLQIIDTMGFKSVYHLQRGVLEWYQNRLPLVRS